MSMTPIIKPKDPNSPSGSVTDVLTNVPGLTFRFPITIGPRQTKALVVGSGARAGSDNSGFRRCRRGSRRLGCLGGFPSRCRSSGGSLCSAGPGISGLSAGRFNPSTGCRGRHNIFDGSDLTGGPDLARLAVASSSELLSGGSLGFVSRGETGVLIGSTVDGRGMKGCGVSTIGVLQKGISVIPIMRDRRDVQG